MSSNMNPMQLMQMLKGGNPQSFVFQMLEQNAQSNPFFANILQLAKSNKTSEIEQIAINMCKEKGIDFNKEFNSFKNNLGL